ncbi:hypothetical protein WN944_006897 [Citrus x changshan-huyou]|uniref:Uncharacterized protein n=1 Tax=Citrus x changshan-huyou TaxID=2935761 RepID=A0AAP0MMN3_9ROSI
MTVIMLVTAGNFLMETTSEFVASIFVMTKQSLVGSSCACAICNLMDLIAVDWFKRTKRMDHVARRQGCAAQVTIFFFLFFLFPLTD